MDQVQSSRLGIVGVVAFDSHQSKDGFAASVRLVQHSQRILMYEVLYCGFGGVYEGGSATFLQSQQEAAVVFCFVLVILKYRSIGRLSFRSIRHDCR